MSEGIIFKDLVKTYSEKYKDKIIRVSFEIPVPCFPLAGGYIKNGEFILLRGAMNIDSKVYIAKETQEPEDEIYLLLIVDDIWLNFNGFLDVYDDENRIPFEEKILELKKKDDSRWIPCKERYPDIELVHDAATYKRYKSEPALVQTKRGEIFYATYLKTTFSYPDRSYKPEHEWVTYGTGGRKMKVMSKVIAWRQAPEKYEEK